MNVLHCVWFGDEQYRRLARVLDKTARRWCPGWRVEVREVQSPPPGLQSASGAQAHADNHHKLRYWEEAVRTEREGTNLLLLDADTFVNAPLDPLWDYAFDFAYTERPAGTKFPLNAGVVAVRCNAEGRAFMHTWLRADEILFRDRDLHYTWKKRYGGMNQASLGLVLESLRTASDPPRVAALPCREWNCEDTGWKDFGPGTRIVHVKSALRMTVFGTGFVQSTQPLARTWRDLETAV